MRILKRKGTKLFEDDLINNDNENLYKKFVEKVRKTFTKEINDGKSIGSISELYDSKKPYEAKGAFAQCWSVSEVFRIII